MWSRKIIKQLDTYIIHTLYCFLQLAYLQVFGLRDLEQSLEQLHRIENTARSLQRAFRKTWGKGTHGLVTIGHKAHYVRCSGLSKEELVAVRLGWGLVSVQVRTVLLWHVPPSHAGSRWSAGAS